VSRRPSLPGLGSFTSLHTRLDSNSPCRDGFQAIKGVESATVLKPRVVSGSVAIDDISPGSDGS